MNQHSSSYSDNNNNSETFPPANLLTNNSDHSDQINNQGDYTVNSDKRTKTKNENYKIMYSNIRGIKGKKASLTEILHEFNPHIFLITETQLTSNTGVSIEGYTFYSKCRTSAKGGGVGILFRNDIKTNIAPHFPDRDIELMWISLRRKNLPPLFIATYYGKQENKTTKDEIEREMMLLNEEISEMKQEGEIMIVMDGNAKIGILGEPISRNRYCSK